jgi:hypothetical protein
VFGLFFERTWRVSLSIGVRITVIRCVVYLLRIFKMFHGLKNNPVCVTTVSYIVGIQGKIHKKKRLTKLNIKVRQFNNNNNNNNNIINLLNLQKCVLKPITFINTITHMYTVPPMLTYIKTVINVIITM